MQPCYTCGRPYDESFPDWTICGSCMWEQEQQRGVVFIDNLGISWTQQEIDEAGGIEEVKKMAYEADARIVKQ